MSIDYADHITEKRLKALENRLKKEYKKAYEEMCDTWDQYINGYDEYVLDKDKNPRKVHHKSLQERYDEELEKFKSGKSGYKDQAEFNAWYQTQIQRGIGYQRTADELAMEMLRANQRASAYINDDAYAIYALNANYQAYQISKDYAGVDFHIVSEDTIKELVTGANHVEFRTTSIDPQRDYAWNRDKITSALISGILQGKSINKLADSFYVVMGRNRASAIRNARTSLTSAMNGGRQTTAERALKMGIHNKKKWLSVGDERTRFSHAMLNGQIREIDQVFSNGLMYPADPSGSPAEVYNCRCKRLYVNPKYEDTTSNEIYSAWENMSPEEQKAEIKNFNAWVNQQKKNKEKNDGSYTRQRYLDVRDELIAGVTKGKPMAFKEADSGHVNPDYGKGKGFESNCQSVVVAYEARRRGYDVKAMPYKENTTSDRLAHDTSLAYINPMTGKHPDYIRDINAITPIKQYTFMERMVEQGERWTFEFEWKGRKQSGHIVNLERNDQGKLMIKDNQRGKDERSEWIGINEILEYLKRIKYTKKIKGVEYECVPSLMRVDNLEFDKTVVNDVVKANG